MLQCSSMDVPTLVISGRSLCFCSLKSIYSTCDWPMLQSITATPLQCRDGASSRSDRSSACLRQCVNTGMSKLWSIYKTALPNDMLTQSQQDSAAAAAVINQQRQQIIIIFTLKRTSSHNIQGKQPYAGTRDKYRNLST